MYELFLAYPGVIARVWIVVGIFLASISILAMTIVSNSVVNGVPLEVLHNVFYGLKMPQKTLYRHT
ncbi:MAG: hypothetical protein ACJA13_002577 [Paraglaciecola sp.]|jgi:hypothetical protein